ncbi:hypothetical protein AAHH79_36230, partial [Burkholderia pseudomallei]
LEEVLGVLFAECLDEVLVLFVEVELVWGVCEIEVLLDFGLVARGRDEPASALRGSDGRLGLR